METDMKRAVILFFLLAAALAGGWYWQHEYGHTRNGTPVFYGNVDIREVRLGFRVGGRVLEVLKEEGDPVAAGDVLARLDDELFRNAVNQAEAKTAQLLARLEELRHGSRPEEIERARKNLLAAEAATENTRLVFERLQKLVHTGAAARQDFDTARAAYHEAQARRDAARAELKLFQAGARSEQIDQAQAAYDAARAELAQARVHLADTVLTAPEPGVLLTRAVEPGSMVQAGSTAVTVSLGQPVRIRAYAPEPELGQVFPGREALVYTDSRPEPYHGQIGDVSPRAEFTPKSVETTDLRTSLVYRFRVTVRDADNGLRQGMPVTVRLAE